MGFTGVKTTFTAALPIFTAVKTVSEPPTLCDTANPRHNRRCALKSKALHGQSQTAVALPRAASRHDDHQPHPDRIIGRDDGGLCLYRDQSHQAAHLQRRRARSAAIGQPQLLGGGHFGLFAAANRHQLRPAILYSAHRAAHSVSVARRFVQPFPGAVGLVFRAQTNRRNHEPPDQRHRGVAVDSNQRRADRGGRANRNYRVGRLHGVGELAIVALCFGGVAAGFVVDWARRSPHPRGDAQAATAKRGFDQLSARENRGDSFDPNVRDATLRKRAFSRRPTTMPIARR